MTIRRKGILTKRFTVNIREWFRSYVDNGIEDKYDIVACKKIYLLYTIETDHSRKPYCFKEEPDALDLLNKNPFHWDYIIFKMEWYKKGMSDHLPSWEEGKKFYEKISPAGRLRNFPNFRRVETQKVNKEY